MKRHNRRKSSNVKAKVIRFPTSRLAKKGTTSSNSKRKSVDSGRLAWLDNVDFRTPWVVRLLLVVFVLMLSMLIV